MMVDEAHIFVSSGKGGAGAVSFHKAKYKPRGAPDGGNGGRGGSVVLEAGPGAGSLSWLSRHPHQIAGTGVAGGASNCSGANAPDLILNVPAGTLVKDEQGRILADLAVGGDRVTVARGGRGGRGNAAFVSSRRRAPGFGELGEPGEERWLRLELALIADVAVIGLPNAGKSTLVGALSAARPKVADYPFTTLEPSLGVVRHHGMVFTMCDIPGLIAGAHQGKGLGLKFLRHATRSGVFVLMIDLASEAEPVAAFRTVTDELRRYRQDLSERPMLIALNKMDLVTRPKIDRIRQEFVELGLEVITISAAGGTGLDELTECLARLVAAWRAGQAGPQGFELFSTEPDPIRAVREGELWRVSGGAVERLVAMTDLSNPEAVSYLQLRMDRAGVEQVLATAGAEPGDEVRIGPSVFTWWPNNTVPGEAFLGSSR